MIVNCQICGKEFKTIPWKIKHGKSRFCSNKCKSISRIKTIIKKCSECEKEFKVQPHRLLNNRGKFCSKECLYRWKSKQTGIKSHRWGRIDKFCVFCHKLFTVKKSHANKRKYCSKKCMSLGYRYQLKNKQNPNWRGGISSETSGIRTSIKYQEWRQKIFIRDDFTCHDCKQVGGNLEAHHIKRFTVIIGEIKHNLPLFPLYEAAMIYKPLWDIDNGITLCEKCHDKKGRHSVPVTP